MRVYGLETQQPKAQPAAAQQEKKPADKKETKPAKSQQKK